MFTFASRAASACLLLLLTLGSFSKAHSATVYAVTGGQGGQAVDRADRDAESFLYRIDQDTGVATLIGTTGVTQFTSLAFDPVSKQLYGHQNNRSFDPDMASEGDSLGFLHRIDLSTGQAELIGGTNSQISDISFDSSGQLHGWMQFTFVEPETATSDRLLRIDKNNNPLVITAIAVAIPEPATVSAMACILFAWQFRRRRRPIRRS